MDPVAAAGDLHLQNKNSTTEHHPMLFCSSLLVSITDPTRIHLLSFFCNLAGILCLSMRLKFMAASGVHGFGLSGFRTSGGLFGNVLLKYGDMHSVMGDPHKRQVLVSLTHVSV